MGKLQPRFPLMDAMRAIAAAFVIAFHVGVTFGVDSASTTLRQFTGRLESGVWIFFVISGFLLYRPFVAARLAGDPVMPLRGYAWRRGLRIFPGYWVALIVFTVWFSVPNVFTVADAPRQFLLVQNYWPSSFGLGLGQAWSLCVELAFYVFLPLLALAMARIPGRRPRTSLWLEVGVVVLIMAIGIAYRTWAIESALAYAPRFLPWYLDAFGAGMLLAVLSAHFTATGRRPAAVRVIERFPGLAWAGAVLTYWVVATRIGLTGDVTQAETIRQLMLKPILYTAFATLLVLPAVWGVPGRGLVPRALALAPMRFAGRISYGMFLYGGLVIALMAEWHLSKLIVPHFTYAIWVALTLALTMFAGTLSWYLVESPMLRLKRFFRPAAKPAALSTPPGDVVPEW